jgi:hypothetical protein
MSHVRRPLFRISVGTLAWLFAIPIAVAIGAQGAPPGEVGIGLLEAPKSRADDPRARIYIVDHLNPGDTIKRKIGVYSGLDKTVRIRLYAAGAAVSSGQFRFFDGRRQDELTSWTTVNPSTVLLTAKGSATALVTISVPSSATDAERYGVVWAELPPSRSASGGVTEVNRVGVRMYVSIGTGDEPPSDFTIDSLTASRDKARRPHVAASVRNTGKRALDLEGELTLANGPGGLRAGPFPVKLGTTLGIGETEPVQAILDPAIPDGPWDAKLTLRSGLIEHTATGRILFPSRAGVTAQAVPAHPVKRRGALLVIATILLILILLLFWFFFWKRRRRDEEPDEKAQEPTRTAAR